jgi:hypothetical protein
MAKNDKLIQKILQGQTDANINFEELCALLKNFGFEERIPVATIFIDAPTLKKG